LELRIGPEQAGELTLQRSRCCRTDNLAPLSITGVLRIISEAELQVSVMWIHHSQSELTISITGVSRILSEAERQVSVMWIHHSQSRGTIRIAGV
jgi:hypothetical protein